MAQTKMSGNMLGVEIDGEFVSCETSCEVAFETDLRGASAQSSGRWKEYIEGVRSWNVTLNANMLIKMAGTGLNTILNKFLTGGQLGVRIATKQVGMPSFSLEGNVLIRTGGFNAAVNSTAAWNVTLEGNGAFTTVISVPDIYNTIFYGNAVTRPTTEAEITALTNGEYTTSPIVVGTGTRRIMVMAVPIDKKIVSVISLTTSEDLTDVYIPEIMEIGGIDFDVYILENAIPYDENNEHEFLLGDD